MSQDFAQLAADVIANLPDGATPADARRALQTLAPIDQVAALATTTPGSATSPGSLTDLTDVTGTPGLGKSPVDDGSGTFPLTPITTQQDLDDVLARVAGVTWNDIGTPNQPPFQSSFRNIGDPWSPARYRVLANSTVRLQGTVTSDDPSIADATWIPIFQLPAEVAPGHNLEFSALTNDNAISRMYVWNDGTVVWGGYAIGPHAPITRLPLNFLSWSTQGPAT
jgi:hypothetical protein